MDTILPARFIQYRAAERQRDTWREKHNCVRNNIDVQELVEELAVFCDGYVSRSWHDLGMSGHWTIHVVNLTMHKGKPYENCPHQVPR